MNYQHVIWDFDGTLFNTYPAMNRAIRLAAADMGAVVSADRVARLLKQTLALCMETITMDYGLDRARFDERYNYYRMKQTPDEQPPMPGALAICRRIMDAGGHNYIFTHRDHESMGELLDWYQARPLFEALSSSLDGIARKPNPAGFLGLIEQFHLAPETVIAVGDRLLDVLAAAKAGIAACLLTRDPEALAKPQYIIGHLDELGTVLGLE